MGRTEAQTIPTAASSLTLISPNRNASESARYAEAISGQNQVLASASSTWRTLGESERMAIGADITVNRRRFRRFPMANQSTRKQGVTS